MDTNFKYQQSPPLCVHGNRTCENIENNIVTKMCEVVCEAKQEMKIILPIVIKTLLIK